MSESKPLSVTAFTGGRNVPSARFRVRELIPHLAKFDIDLVEQIPLISKYPPRSKLIRPLWFCASAASRIPGIINSYKSDITILQREFVSTVVTLEKLSHGPRVLDVDDAIHIHRNGRTARKLASYCDLVLCGNTFLAEWYDTLNVKTALLPTGIDAARFTPKENIKESNDFRIGWTGSSSNLKYLYQIEPALQVVLQKFPEVKLSIICDEEPKFNTIKHEQTEYHKWNANNEVKHLQDFDIGIMPLSDSEWERGKCAFKILQYMSCCIPVVATPTGVNLTILNDNEVGFSATQPDEWIDALIYFIENKDARIKAGKQGRKTILAEYDSPIIAATAAAELKCLVSA